MRVHAVDIRSGKYIMSDRTSHPLAPISTRSCYLNNVVSLPKWNEELALHSPLSTFASTDSIILLEILDKRTPLNNSRTIKQKKTLQRVAWCFLRPVGEDGVINYGYPTDWNASKSVTAKEKRLAREKREKEDNDVVADASIASRSDSQGSGSDSVDRKHSLQLYAFQEDSVLEQLQRRVNGWSDYANIVPLTTEASSLEDIPESYIQWRRRVLVKIPGE